MQKRENIELDGFHYEVEVIKDGRVIDALQIYHNKIPQEGLSHVASMILASGATPSPWYVGIFEGNYIPSSTSKASDLPNTVGECTAYTETMRQGWIAAHDDTDNVMAADKAVEFTLSADKTIYGAFLASSNAKGSGSGKLLSIARFPSPYVLTAGSVLRVRPILSILATQV